MTLAPCRLGASGAHRGTRDHPG